jgi:peptide/nickel transport system permease protein
VLDQDFIRTARAKGVAEAGVVWVHAFRNTFIAVLTVIGYIASLLIGGSVIVEQVFALPGVGRLVVQAVLTRDYPLVQGALLLFGFIFVLINIVTDILYTLVDPRVRYD